MIRILQLTTIVLLCNGYSAWSQCSFTISTSVTNVSCYNGTTGAVSVSVTGGTAPYQYQLAEAGAGAWQSSSTFTSLVANIYPVSVKDATGCIKTVYVTVSQPASLVATYTETDATCTNSNDGRITTNTTGGTAPYSYSWTKNGSAFATSANLSSLAPANYLLTVTDANGCTTTPVITSDIDPISLTGFNQDVIANGTGAPTASATQPLDDHSYVFYASGYKISSTAGSAGLPASGSFSSAQSASRTYQLASYTASNSLVLSSGATYGSATSGTLSFATQHRSPYATLYVVGTTGNGTGTVNYTVNFSDATTYTGSLTFPDWFLAPATASTQRALGSLDRVSWLASGAAYEGSTNFNLFEAPITIPVASQGKNVNSVAFTWGGSSSARINLFAITGYTSTTVGIRVNDGPASNVTPAVTVASNAPSNTFCSGQSVTFTATPLNGGTAPTYQWYKNGTIISGATGSTYTTSTISTSDKFHAVMTSSLTCVSSASATATQVTMTSGTVPASVSASSTATSICSGASVTFSATPVNGGASPTYQWYKNGTIISGATGSTYTASDIANADNIKVIMTSNISCATTNPATSNTIPMNVTASGSPTISISAVPAVSFTSTSTFAGASPTYEWYKNGTIISGATGSSYSTSTAAVNDVYSVKMTSSYTCKTAPAAKSNYITVTAATLPVTLEAYSLSVDNNKVMIKWRTSYEQNNKQFLVERAFAGGNGFSTVGVVSATNNKIGSSYSYMDEPVVAGSYQYRLVQEDIDGKLDYFDIKTAVIKSSGTFKVIDQASEWKIISDKTLKYEFMDAEGRLLERGTFQATVLISKPSVKGLYLLRFMNDRDVYVQKLMVR